MTFVCVRRGSPTHRPVRSWPAVVHRCDGPIIADVTVDPYNRAGEATLVLVASPMGGWSANPNANWDLHGFFDKQPLWSGPDTVILGSAALGEGLAIPASMQDARRWMFELSGHQVDWVVEDNAPLQEGETREVRLPDLVEITVDVPELNGDSASHFVCATIPATESRPRLSWARWDEALDPESGTAALLAPEGSSLEVSVKTALGRVGRQSLAYVTKGAVIEVELATTEKSKVLTIDAPNLDLVRASAHDGTNLFPEPTMRRSPDGLFRLVVPLTTYSLDIYSARGPGIRIRLLDSKSATLPTLVISDHALPESALRLIDERGHALVGAHVELSPTMRMREGAGPYVPRVTPDGAFEVTWHNRIHGITDTRGRIELIAPSGEYEVKLEGTSGVPTLGDRMMLEPSSGVITLSPGSEATLTCEALRRLALRIHVADHPFGEPRRFEVGLEGKPFPQQFSGDRAQFEIGTAARRVRVCAPGLERAMTVDVPAGRGDLTFDVDL